MSAVAPVPTAAVLLAAGRGTRMKSRRAKPLHPLLGKPMGRYPIDCCRAAGIERLVTVVGFQADEVRAALGDDVDYALQAEPRGTGHAVLAAEPELAGWNGTVLVLLADCVLLTPEQLTSLLERHAASGAAATLLTFEALEPGAYGRIRREADGSVAAIVEARDAPPELLAIREVNSGVIAFRSPLLWELLRELAPDPSSGELYLTDAIHLLRERDARVEAVLTEDPDSARSVNDRVELAEATAILRQRILRQHMLNGVTIEDPATTYVDADVRIGADTVLRPMTWLTGRTVIGEECDIGPSARIADSTLGNGISVQSAVITESEIGDGTKIGPFAQLRPGCRVGRKVKIGNFVELKNAVVEDGVSAGHLAYIGDASVGEKTNIGAGTITCNYDGQRKHRTTIGKQAFIGSHSTLIAPVAVGEGAYTAAGSVITEEVPPDALAIGRGRQVNKPEWAKRKRERES
jgi:bifunctional UDP-N-acetylglucosamine pyrophosphorylase/glucosamine-1-phosphate N-acetyltransferase